MPYTTYPAIRIYTSCMYSPPFDNCSPGNSLSMMLAMLFLGLSWAPEPDNQIFIISEYIHNKSKPFPWCLRLSFATDIAHALAYLHTRKCIHRDLKGENLLVTSNRRLKITDFSFARITTRNDEELKQLTFCGTDLYMSPEVLLGDEFRPAHRHYIQHRWKTKIQKLTSLGCPPDMIALCLDCLVLARPSEDEDAHIGSIKFMTGGKRPKDIRSSRSSTDDSDDELMEAVTGLSSLGVNSGWSDSTGGGNQPLLNTGSSEYSTTVIHSASLTANSASFPFLYLNHSCFPKSKLRHQTKYYQRQTLHLQSRSTIMAQRAEGEDLLGISSIMSIDSLDLYHTAADGNPVLECDDCGLKAHIKCGEVALRDCGLQPSFHDHTTGMSPVSKVKQGGKGSPTR
ncbi:kinase-like domain-containing protein [Armillaria mellea]|nr:kinase-like domain-containing protein [Armillaria mellea]